MGIGFVERFDSLHPLSFLETLFSSTTASIKALLSLDEISKVAGNFGKLQ
jgi:hypothetical protein